MSPIASIRLLNEHGVGRSSGLTWLAVLLLLGALLEAFALGALAPLLGGLLLESGAVAPDGPARAGGDSTEGLRGLMAAFGPYEDGWSLGLLAAFIWFAFLARTAILLFAMSRVGILVAGAAADLRARLVDQHARATWQHLQTLAPGALAHAVGFGADRAAAVYLQLAHLVSRAFLAAMLTLTAAWVAGPGALLVMALAAGILGLGLWFIRPARRAGEAQARAASQLSELVVDALHGIKSCKAMGRGEALVAAQREVIQALAGAQAKAVGLSEWQRRMPEPVAVLAILLMVLGGQLGGVTEPEGLGVNLALALMLGRLVQALTGVQALYQGICVGAGTVRQIDAMLTAARAAEQSPGLDGPGTAQDRRVPVPRGELVVEGVAFAYDSRPLLSGASLTVAEHEVVVVRGVSGAGKTTLLDIIAGLLEPDGGQMRMGERTIEPAGTPARQRRLGYVPAEPHLFDASLLENVRLGDGAISEADVRAALVIASAGAPEWLAGLEHDLEARFGHGGMNLSSGQRQRLALARALAGDPSLLCLDEPTNSLDEAGERAVGEAVRAWIRAAPGRRAVVVSHRGPWCEVADRVYRLEAGQLHPVAAGEPR